MYFSYYKESERDVCVPITSQFCHPGIEEQLMTIHTDAFKLSCVLLFVILKTVVYKRANEKPGLNNKMVNYIVAATEHPGHSKSK